jgi:hypothetical protein
MEIIGVKPVVAAGHATAFVALVGERLAGGG